MYYTVMRKGKTVVIFQMNEEVKKLIVKKLKGRGQALSEFLRDCINKELNK